MELRDRGYAINHKTVQRLVSLLQLKCMVRSKNKENGLSQHFELYLIA